MHPGDRVLVRNLTPRGGTGKLRNHWEDTIHTVIRRVGEEGPVYEVKPEGGKGRSRVLHRNLLLPCDYLPMEMELRTQPRTKRKVDKPTSVRRDDSSSEEDDDGCSHWYLPAVQSQQPVKENRELTSGNLPVIQPSETEKERDEIGQELAKDHGTEVRIENEAIPQQEVDVMEEEQPGETSDTTDGHLALWESNGEKGQECRLPKRERRPPKTFTYDYLGTPACYTVEEHSDTLAFQPTPCLVQNMTPWTYPTSQYQPVYFYTYKDLYAH